MKNKLEWRKNIKVKHISYRQKRRIILVLIFLVVFIFVFKYRRQLAPSNIMLTAKDLIVSIGSGNGYPYNLDGMSIETNNMNRIGGNLLFASDTSVISLNSSAKDISKRKHGFSTPILKVGGSKFITYNLMGKNFRVESRSEILVRGTSDENIITAAVSDSGMYVLVTEAKGHCCAMTVYDSKSQNVKYKYYFSSCAINDVAIDDDGKKIVTVGQAVVDGKSVSQVNIFDLYSTNPIKVFDYVDTVILSLNYLNDGKVVAIGNNMSSFINIKKLTKEDYKYENKTLKNYACDKNHGVVLVLAATDDMIEGSLEFLDISGKHLHSLYISDQVFDISYLNDTVAYITNGKVVYHKNASLKSYTIDIDVNDKKIILTHKDTAYVTGLSYIKKLKLS